MLHDDSVCSLCGRSVLHQIIPQDRINRGGALKDSAHPSHAAKELTREADISKEMIIQKIKMTAREPINLRERIINLLCVKRASAFKETIFVAEGAVMWTFLAKRQWNSAPGSDGVL